jgi:ribosomal protein S18 acetylase RimI-like enzyme
VEEIIVFSETDALEVDTQLIRYNGSVVPYTQEKPFIKLCFGVKRDDASIEAGIIGVLYCWGMLYIDAIWVDEQSRDRGLGTKLMERLEKEAQKRGCTLAHLDTFDFQARAFYERQGYELFGTLDGCPPGHKRYFLKKPL